MRIPFGHHAGIGIAVCCCIQSLNGTLIERQFAALPALDSTARSLQRLYVGNAQEVDIDAQGRISLPQYLRDFASLD